MASTLPFNRLEEGRTAEGPPDGAADNPWDTFLQARVAAIGWLHQQARLNDGEIAKALGMTATEVFLVRARQSRNRSCAETDGARTQAAPLGDS